MRSGEFDDANYKNGKCQFRFNKEMILIRL